MPPKKSKNLSKLRQKRRKARLLNATSAAVANDHDYKMEEQRIKRKFLSSKKAASTSARSKVKLAKKRLRTADESESCPVIREIKIKKEEQRPGSAAAPDDPSSSARRFEVVNPEAYWRVVSRVEENQINKVPRPTNGHVIEGQWICALCQQPPAERSLGDLFGPYYVKLGPTLKPPFLKMKGSPTRNHGDIYTDLWFHGYCALWTSGLLAKGNVLTGLEEHLGDYWFQKCVVCQISGASIGCFVKGCKKMYHFCCASQAGCVLKEENLTMFCQIHKKLSET